MLSVNQKLIFVAVLALVLHLLFFDYQFGGEPDLVFGGYDIPFFSFRLLGIYNFGVHVTYNGAAVNFFNSGTFIPQLFGIAIPTVLILFVGFVSYNKIKATPEDKKEI